MKKSLLISALMALAVLPSAARQLTPDEAYGRLSGSDRAKAGAAAVVSPRLLDSVKTKAGVTTLYVFATKDKTLFVSADDAAVPLLGYIDNPAVDLSNMPPSMTWWLGEYSRQIEWASANGIVSSIDGAATDYEMIAPLCATKWDQDAPYNGLCPLRNGVTTVTGCVATAMAQVMNYHKWPATGQGSIAYDWNNETLSMDFSTVTFDWLNMLNIYPEATSGTETQRAAVATLMKACGHSVEMGYDVAPIGSNASSYGLANALVEFFSYDKEARMEMRDFYVIDDWNAMIYQSLYEHGPVLYGGSGVDVNTGEITVGHEFVVDGYEGDGYFHVNWGWSGYCDGAFKLDALNPDDVGIGGGDGSGFNYNQDVTLAIQLPQSGTSYPDPYIGICGDLEAEVDGRDVMLSAGGDDDGFFNCGNYDGYFLMGLKLVNSVSEETYYVALGSEDEADYLESFDGYEYLVFSVPETVPDGTYNVSPVYKLNGSGDWTPCKTYYYASPYATVQFGAAGIGSVESDRTGEGETRWFNVLGQPVSDSSLQPGLYLKQAGGKTTKVMVK